MDMQHLVKQFISDSKNLYRKLRSHGEELSDLDLVALREQLHMLDTRPAIPGSQVGWHHFTFHGRRPELISHTFARRCSPQHSTGL
jgi:hypothetical protein